VLELSSDQLRALPEATAEDFAPPAAPKAWILKLDERAKDASVKWKALFVSSIEELKRRDAAWGSK
jgi:hypothetical protein